MPRPRSPEPTWVRADLRWYPQGEGGRAVLPDGPVYCPTARLLDAPLDGMFSVGIRLSPPADRNGSAGDRHQPVEFALMFPENYPDVVARLTPGANLVVHEGSRAVGELTVSSAIEAPVPAATA